MTLHDEGHEARRATLAPAPILRAGPAAALRASDVVPPVPPAAHGCLARAHTRAGRQARRRAPGLYRPRGVHVTASYDRKATLEAADRARLRGRTRAAIAAYRALLAVDRSEPEVHAKLAPLLARAGQRFDAWVSFRAAAEGFMRAQQPERALAVYYEAAHHLPRDPDVWYTIARLQSARGKPEDALRALRTGRAKLRRRRDRPLAIYLLRQMHELSPWTTDIVLDLARLLAKTRQRPEALHILEALAHRVSGVSLRRARGLQLRIAPRLAYLWPWLRCVVARPGRVTGPSSARS